MRRDFETATGVVFAAEANASGESRIAPEGGGKDIFVHVTAVQAAGLHGLNEGQRVQFEADKRGPKAVNLKLV